KEFKETEKKLKDAGLPAEIMKRHDEMVRYYNENFSALRTQVNEIRGLQAEEQSLRKAGKSTEADAKNKELKTGIVKARDFLKDKIKKRPHAKLYPNNLPHRTPKPIDREPRLNKEDFRDPNKGPVVDDRKPVQVAALGDLSGLVLAQSTNAPTVADLAETIEVKFTPDIQAKAAELNHDPVKIFNWVRNNIDFVPTYGSIQGAQMTLETLQGNAFDQASFLIALLRASNIPARYEYGTVEIPVDKAMNWVGGVTDPMLAGEVLASNGIPGKLMQAGGKIVYVRLEHIWVKAYVDYIPSRGAIHKQGDTWVPMDPSFKQFDYTTGIDIASEVPFDAEAFVNQIQSTANINEAQGYVTNVDQAYIEQTMTSYQQQVEAYIAANHPDATVGDVLGKKIIQEKQNPVLFASLPYHLVVKAGEYAAIPNSLRHKVSFKVLRDQLDEYSDTALNYTASIPELAGKKITLSYSPATPSDEAVIESYLPEPHPDGTPIQPGEFSQTLPAYLINLRPELKIDGQVVASGTAVGLGQTEAFTLQFADPSRIGNELISMDVTAGEYDAMAIDPLAMSPQGLSSLRDRMETTTAKLLTENLDGLTKDAVIGDLLYGNIAAYFAALDAAAEITERRQNIINHRLPSAGRFLSGLNVQYFFGIPRSVSAKGLEMDVVRSFRYALERSGDREKTKEYNLMVGMNSSALEHGIPEQILSNPDNPPQGVSAVKALSIANSQGIPIYHINRQNVSSILPNLQLDGDDINDIVNAVNAGKEVTASQINISFNGWTGCGYIIIDPVKGDGAYRISGGSHGAYMMIAQGAELIQLGMASDDLEMRAYYLSVGAMYVKAGLCVLESSDGGCPSCTDGSDPKSALPLIAFTTIAEPTKTVLVGTLLILSLIAAQKAVQNYLERSGVADDCYDLERICSDKLEDCLENGWRWVIDNYGNTRKIRIDCAACYVRCTRENGWPDDEVCGY
ncbi:MAG: hypothetical protein CO150_08345, partial [Nitrospirae bacterium CG_4_9_14_3_um_filter_53_35]